ncbi:hypothetical protein NMY22_g8034 [Coprinellus aureogranulatus]|nr:hypothetical protein NMY22_g8034 [Coprinellus aureogranulatus]
MNPAHDLDPYPDRRVQTGETATMNSDLKVSLRQQFDRSRVRISCPHLSHTAGNLRGYECHLQPGVLREKSSSWSSTMPMLTPSSIHSLCPVPTDEEHAGSPQRRVAEDRTKVTKRLPHPQSCLRAPDAKENHSAERHKRSADPGYPVGERGTDDLRNRAPEREARDGDTHQTKQSLRISSRSKRETCATASANAASSSIAAPGHENGARLFIDYIAVPPNPWKSARTQSTAAVKASRTGKATTITLEPLPPDPTPNTGSKRKRDSLGSEEDPLRKRKDYNATEGIASTPDVRHSEDEASPDDEWDAVPESDTTGDEDDAFPSEVSSDEETDDGEATDEDDDDWEERDARQEGGIAEKSPPLSTEELERLLFGAKQPETDLPPFIQEMSALSYNSTGKVFNFKGKTCTHDLVDDASDSPYCALMDAFRLELFGDRPRFCIDRNRKIMLMTGGLHKMFKHAVKITKSTILKADVMLEHIRRAYQLSDETPEQVRERFRAITLKAPLDSLSPPAIHTQCPECENWVINVHVHHSKKHREVKRKNSPDRAWFILPLGKGSGCSKKSYFHSVMLKVSSTKLQSQDVLDTPAVDHTEDEDNPPRTRTIPSYVTYLAWPLYLNAVIKEVPIFLSAQALAESHSKRWCAPLRAGSNSRSAYKTIAAVESSLPHLQEAVVKYLALADCRLLSSHDSVRKLVTQGQKGLFRSIGVQTRLNYARFCMRAIRLALRWVAGVNENHPVIQQLLNGKWLPNWKGNQKEKSEGFLEHIVETFGKKRKKDEWPAVLDTFQDKSLGFIHQFFISAFTERFDTGKPVNSILEQIVLFYSFSEYAGWRPGHLTIGGSLIQLQYLSRSVLVHCAYLGGYESLWNASLTGCDAESGSENDGDNDSARDGEGDIDDDGPDWGIVKPKAKATPADGTNGLSRRFTDLQEPFESEGSEYQWGRFAGTWTVMRGSSRRDPSSTVMQWDVKEGVKFSFKARYCKITLDLDDYLTGVEKLPGVVWTSFVALFPSKYPPEALAELSNLTVASFDDNITSTDSLFTRPRNIALLKRYITLLEESSAADSGWSASYPSLLGDFHTVLSQGIMIPNGIGMRSFQLAGLKFSAVGPLPRSVYVESGMCYVGKPEAKQRFNTKKYYDAYWQLDGRIGLALLLYGGLFRCIEAKRFAQTPAQFAPISPFIFVKLSTDKEDAHVFTRWTGSDVNRSMMGITSPLKAEARVQRHFSQGLIQRYLSDEAALLMLEFQRDINAKWDDPRNVERRRVQQLSLSRAVHGLLGLRDTPVSTPAKEVYRDEGLELARHLVRCHYHLHGDDVQGIRSKVATLRSTKPFLYGSEDSVEATDKFGDSVLIAVTSSLIYGPKQPAALGGIPINGFAAETVAQSVAIIWAAIQEWSQGIQKCGKFTEASFDSACKVFSTKITELRMQRRKAYLRFCNAVQAYASRPGVSLEETPDPYIVPQTALMPFSTLIESEVRVPVPRLQRKTPN